MDVDIIDLSSDDDDFEKKAVESKKKITYKNEAVPSTSKTVISYGGTTNGMNGSHVNKEKEDVVVKEEKVEKLSATAETTIALKLMLDECKAIENSKTMSEIIEKVWKKYNRCKPEFRESEEFLKLIKENHSAVVDDPKLKYKYIKNVMEEMVFHRTLKRRRSHESTATPNKRGRESSPHPSTSNVSEESNDAVAFTCKDQELSEEKREKRERHVRKLWRAYNQCMRKIEELEQAEVDWDTENEDESQYLIEDRYKRRLMQIYKKIQELTDYSVGRLTKKKIYFSETKYTALNRKVEKFVNKAKTFPDFLDVKKVISQGNEEFNLQLSSDEVDSFARMAFGKIGRQLQRHREQELQDNLSCLLPPDASADPAEEDPELERKLRDNQEQYKHREAELMTMYTKKADEKDLKPEEFQSGDEEEKDPEEEEDPESEPEQATELNPEEMTDCSDSEREEEHKDNAEERAASPTGYVSSPGNTPEEDYHIDITAGDDDEATQPYVENIGSQSNSLDIKLIDAFSIAETPEKLPKECGLILKDVNKTILLQALKLNNTKISETPITTFSGALANCAKTENNNIIKSQVKQVVSEENDRKIVISSVSPIKCNGPSLSKSPKVSLNIIPSLNSPKAQKARKSFSTGSSLSQSPITKFFKSTDNLQTPEISSSSQDPNVVDDDDCIVLSD